MHFFFTAYKVLLLGAHVLSGLLQIIGIRMLPRSWKAQLLPVLTQRWHRRLCRILGLRLEVQGTPCSGPALWVANHISWLDIPALGSLQKLDFLSKAEVRDWPIIGMMASMAGTLFIDRGQGRALTVSESLAMRLRQGHSALIFPEGTSSDGTQVLHFHPRLFATVHLACAPIQPVALRYRAHPQPHPVAPFVGDDSFTAHLWNVLQCQELVLEVHYCPPMEPRLQDRRTLASMAHQRIRAALYPGEGSSPLVIPAQQQASNVAWPIAAASGE